MWTKKAVAHLTTGITAMLLAVLTGSLGLALLGLVFAVPVIVAFLVQRRPLIDSSRTMNAERIREQENVQVVLGLRGKGMFGTGFVEVRDRLSSLLDVVHGSSYRIVNLARGRQVDMDYEVHAAIRGLYSIGPVELRKTDSFEFFYQVSKVDDSISGLTVLPRTQDLKEAKIKSLTPKIISGDRSVRSPGIGSDFYALRQYTSSDPMRDVNWKASARAGELIVNQWERETIAVVTLVVDGREVNGAGSLGENPLIYNARAAATLADHFIAERATIRLLTYGDEVHTIQPDSGDRQMYKILDHMARLEAHGDMPLGDVVHGLIPQLNSRSPVLIVSSLEDDQTVLDAVTTLLAHNMFVNVFTPSLPDFLRNADDSPVGQAEYALRRARHQLVIKQLRGLGVPVVHWSPGERLEVAMLSGVIQ